MSVFDDGTPVQPGDYVRAEVLMPGQLRRFFVEGEVYDDVDGGVVGYTFLDDQGLRGIRRVDRPAKPRPPLPTQLGAVVWVGGAPYFLGYDGWISAEGVGPLDMSFAEQDWTTTPPEAS